MIFKSHCCFESEPSSRSSAGRPKKSTPKKSIETDDDVQRSSKRRSKSVAEPEKITVEKLKTDFEESSNLVSGEQEDFYQEEEPAGMNGVNEEVEWQHQGNAPFAQGHHHEMPLDEMADGEEYYAEDGSPLYEQNQIGQNQIVLTLSYSLMNQVRQTARMEGVLPEDILIELVAEGVTRRAFEDAQRPAPSHLMTRTGYVAPDANGNVHQPQLSHHGMQGNGNNRGHHNGHNGRRFNQNNNRGGNHFQGRNRQNNHFKNKPRNGK